MLTYLYQEWTNNGWDNLSQDIFTYTTGDKIATRIYEEWDGGGWVNYSRTTYAYNSNGKVDNYIMEEWSNFAWANVGKISYTYNGSGHTSLMLAEQWTGGSWLPYFRSTYSYNNNWGLLSDIREMYNSSNWINFIKAAYTYDGDNNAIKGESFKWSNNSWVITHGQLNMEYNNANDTLSFNASAITASYLHVSGVNENQSMVKDYYLSQNFPNPFNPNTAINFQLPKSGQVTIKVYDVLGNEVKTLVNEYKPAGNYKTDFNASGLSSGVYIYKIFAGDYISSKKMILLK